MLLAIPDGIWGTAAQFALANAVLMAALACTWVASAVETLTGRRGNQADQATNATSTIGGRKGHGHDVADEGHGAPDHRLRGGY